MSNLFVRKATGMVRSWSVFDAFIYAFFSINIVTLGFYSFSQMYFFGGGMINALVVSAIFLIFEIIVYASLIAVMPRSGGDYVWMTRIFGGGIGFILAITGWWFTLWLWTPIYGDMLRQFVLTPLLGVLGQKDLALWFSGKGTPLFVSTLIAIGICIHRDCPGDENLCPHSKVFLLCWHAWLVDHHRPALHWIAREIQSGL